MRIFESFIKYFLFLVLVFSSLYIFSFQRGDIPNETIGDLTEVINGYTLFACLIISAVSSFLFPMWSVRKYLGTQDVEKIAEYIRQYKRVFGMFVLGFFGDILLCNSPQSFFWWVGVASLIYFFFWFFFLRKEF